MSNIQRGLLALLAKLKPILDRVLAAASGLVDRLLGYPPRVAVEVRQIRESAPTGDRSAIELSVTNNGDSPIIIQSVGLRSADRPQMPPSRGDFIVFSNLAEPLSPGASRSYRLYRDKVTNPAFHALFDEHWQEYFRYPWVIDARGKRYSGKMPPADADRR